MIAPRIVALSGLPDEVQARRLRRDLPEAEWRWITRLRQPRDRLRSLLGRALARRLLAPHLDLMPDRVPLAAGPHGQPRLAVPPGSAPAWHVSIAHSGDQVLAAIGPQALGVDVEICPAEVDDALFRYATGRAQAPSGAGEGRRADGGEHSSARDAQVFCAEWVCREAALKACGQGLLIDPARLRLHDRGQGWHRVDGPPGVQGLHVRLLWTSSAHCAALCLPTPRDDWRLTRTDLDDWLDGPASPA